jgi:hypothetical protein
MKKYNFKLMTRKHYYDQVFADSEEEAEEKIKEMIERDDLPCMSESDEWELVYVIEGMK